AGGGVHPGEVRLPGVVVDEQRHHDHDAVRTRDGLGVVGGRPQPPGPHGRAELRRQVRLAGKRLGTGIDQVDDAAVDVDAHDVVTTISELYGQGQPDLAEGDDGYSHGDLKLNRRRGRKPTYRLPAAVRATDPARPPISARRR